MKFLASMLMIVSSQAISFAQETAATAQNQAQQPSFMSMMMPFAIIMGIFYFLMIRPQKKKMEQETKFLNALKKGDEVFTRSGVIGTIYGLTDKVVTLEVAEGVKLKFLKNQIGGDAKTIFATEAAANTANTPKKS